MNRDNQLTFYETKLLVEVLFTVKYSEVISIEEKTRQFLDDWESGVCLGTFRNINIQKGQIIIDTSIVTLLCSLLKTKVKKSL